MQIIFYIIKKEFRQIFRNKIMIPIIFVMPVVQMLVLVYATTYEMKDLKFSVVDKDKTQSSRQLVQKLSASPFFNLVSKDADLKQAQEKLLHDQSDMILVFPNDFESQLIRKKSTQLQIIINAINGTKAGISMVYLNQIIASYNQKIVSKYIKHKLSTSSQIKIEERFWYNPELNYKVYMIPGILVILVTVIGMFLSGLNLVREKEMGTIDQINVTPIKKHQFIIGKLLPFLIIALFDLSLGLLIAKLIFDIPIVGSLLTVFVMALVFLPAALGIGLFFSTLADTQQQVMFVAYFILIIFTLMSGIFTPAESMPHWAQQINILNPMYYFMKSFRMILLKGSTLYDLRYEFISLLIYSISILSLSTLLYRKRS